MQLNFSKVIYDDCLCKCARKYYCIMLLCVKRFLFDIMCRKMVTEHIVLKTEVG